MPIVGVGRDALFALLGKQYTQEEFEELCFEFGIELDDVEEEEVKTTKTRAGSEPARTEVVYKVEVPANRYDILCLEGLARALGRFLAVLRDEGQTLYQGLERLGAVQGVEEDLPTNRELLARASAPAVTSEGGA